jgi:predicted transcriptional regulator
MTISLPPAMVAEVEKVRRSEHRTRSELVREALRSYFDRRYPTVVPTKQERAGIRRGRSDIKAGRFVDLDQLLDGLATFDRAPRAKSARKLSR